MTLGLSHEGILQTKFGRLEYVSKHGMTSTGDMSHRYE